MHHRRPRTDPAELVATLDETEPVRAEVVIDPFLDAPPDDPRAPRNVDLEARVTALEQRASLRKWGERILSGIAGTGLAVLVWALTKAEAQGDAKATARERAAERAWLIETVRSLERRDALQQGQIDGIVDRLRYPTQGPPLAPRTAP